MRKDNKTHVYVVDDDECILSAVCAMITEGQYECTCFGDGESCLKQLEIQKCDLLITDVKMPGKDGMDVLKESMRMAPWLEVKAVAASSSRPARTTLLPLLRFSIRNASESVGQASRPRCAGPCRR